MSEDPGSQHPACADAHRETSTLMVRWIQPLLVSPPAPWRPA